MELELLHASDLHFGRHHHPRGALALRKLVERTAFDLLVFSGDFTQRAKVREYRAAAAYLESLPPIPRVVTAGNHDVPLYRVWERLLFPFRNYRRWIHERLDAVTRIPGATVVSLSSASPLRAIVNGRITGRQLRFARDAFGTAPPEDLRAVVIHHPLVEAPDAEKSVPLPGAHRILGALADMGTELVLSGHFHRAFATRWPLDAGSGLHRLLLVHAGTATSGRGRGGERGANSVNLLRIRAEAIEVTPHRLDPASGAFEPGETVAFPRPETGPGVHPAPAGTPG